VTEEAVNRRFFDQYSVAHAAVGAGFGVLEVGAPLAIGSQVAFEAVENELKRREPDIWPDPRMDGWENQSGDIVSFVVGYTFARLLPKSSRLKATAVLGGAALALWIYGMKQKQAN